MFVSQKREKLIKIGDKFHLQTIIVSLINVLMSDQRFTAFCCQLASRHCLKKQNFSTCLIFVFKKPVLIDVFVISVYGVFTNKY